MYATSALTASPAVEGAIVLGAYNIMATVTNGRPGGLVGGLNGTALGRFGWADANGVVLNQRTSPQDVLGFTLLQTGPQVDWRRVFYDDASQTWRVRRGLPVTMISRGNVWARFPNGAYAGQPVFANVLDGSALSGYSPDGELTPWSVLTDCPPGHIAVITTWSTFS